MKDYCPICGQEVGILNKGAPSPEYFNHRCNPKTLSAINAAQTRTERDFSIADLHEYVVGTRIDEGFKLISMADDEEF